MLNLFKRKEFQPKFPIIELIDTPENVNAKLSAFSNVEKAEDSTEKDIDYTYCTQKSGTRIYVGFIDSKISYINYLTDQFSKTEKQQEEKIDWFLNHYGDDAEYAEPMITEHMIFFRNPTRKLSVVYGLQLGPIRINNLAVVI
jgi:hypothetical protein